MANANFEKMVADVNAYLTNGYRNRLIGATGGGPRFELYHCALSLCSMKVRCVMFEKNIPFFSHDMNIMPAGKFVPENYRPAYVRMRMQGAPGAKLASGYTGQSSVTTEGFDPCVVPTLVDHEKTRVVVDSSKICEYLDAEAGEGPRLIPEELSEQVLAQIEIIDRAPHVAALYGANPDGDRRADGLAKRIEGVQERKNVALRAMKAAVPGDQDLQAAYDAKISKETNSFEFGHDPERMREAYQAMSLHVADLENQLAAHSGQWAMGDSYTMADIMWTVSLYRVKWLGLGHFWEGSEDYPRATAYMERAFQRPSFRAGVIDWPCAYSPSPHVDEFTPFQFFSEMLRRTNFKETFFGTRVA